MILCFNYVYIYMHTSVLWKLSGLAICPFLLHPLLSTFSSCSLILTKPRQVISNVSASDFIAEKSPFAYFNKNFISSCSQDEVVDLDKNCVIIPSMMLPHICFLKPSSIFELCTAGLSHLYMFSKFSGTLLLSYKNYIQSIISSHFSSFTPVQWMLSNSNTSGPILKKCLVHWALYKAACIQLIRTFSI